MGRAGLSGRTMIDRLDAGGRLLSTAGQSCTIEEIAALRDECRRLLPRLGVRRGDPVLLLTEHGAELVPSMLALSEQWLAAPVDPALGPAHISRVVAEVEPAAVVLGAETPVALCDRLRDSGVPLLHLDPGLRLSPDAALHAWGGSGKAGRDAAAAGLLLRTSGTTGEPRWVALGHRQLLHAASGIAGSLRLGPEDRYLCVLPCFHIHGFSTVLAALIAGGEAVVTGETRPEELLRRLDDHAISWLSATPTHYRAVLRANGLEKLQHPVGSLRLVRSASAPMGRQLMEDLSSALAVPVVEAYGMTEAGPLIATNTLEPGGNRPGSVGRPLGVELTIDHHQSVGSFDGAGEICIRGDAVSTAYWAPGSQTDAAGDGWLRTGDLGYLDADGFLYVTGRVRDIINAGGEKLLPAEIEAVLQQHPAVAEAAVYPAPHDSLGEAPHAVLALREGFSTPATGQAFAAQLVEAIRQFCLLRLPRHMLPHRIDVVDAIPKNRAGKVQRQQLHAMLATPRASAQCPPTGHDRPFEGLLALWREQLSLDRIDPGQNFFELGGDSLSAAQLTLHVEARFGVHLDDDFVFHCPTIELQSGFLKNNRLQRRDETDEPATGHAIGELVPLSPGQQRLWFLDRAGAGTGYNMSAPVWLHGELKRQWFEAALADLVRRHATLRTRFRQLDGEPVQCIEQHWQPELIFDDLAELPPDEREPAVLALAASDRRCDFDLSLRPPVRYRLVRLGPRRHALILTVHHIISDGWSISIFYRDLLVLYARLAGVDDVSLPEIRQDYPYFCRSEVAGEEGEHARQQLAWWMKYLRGVDPVIALARRRTAHSSEETGCATVPFEIPAALNAGLTRCSVQRRTGVFPLLLAALQIALFGLCRQSAFCVGTAVANRRKRDFENIFGFFANTLPMAARVGMDDSLLEIVDRVARDCREASRHGDVDFGSIVRELAPARTPGRNPLVQVMFAYQNYPTLDALLPNTHGPLQAESFAVAADRTKFDLTLYLKPGAGPLAGQWQVRQSVLDANEVRRLQGIFLAALASIAGSDRVCVADLLSQFPGENLPPRPLLAVSSSPGLLQAIWRHANTSPDAVAVRAGATVISYGELVERVRLMRCLLTSRGVAAGDRVGVILRRDEAAIITPLALFALGATYLPLDPGYPRARLLLMASGAGIRALVTDSEGVDTAIILADEIGGESLLINVADEAVADLPVPCGREPADPAPGSAAYIIYTSGSTGRPKGVVINHGNLRHYLAAMSSELGLCAEDIWLHTASLSFSSSIRQFALPLYTGGAVCMALREDVLNVDRIPRIVESARITVLDLVPSHWRNLLRGIALAAQGDDGPDDSSLRLLLSASEALPAPLANAMIEQFPTARLTNMYGQSETSGILLVEHSPDRRGPGPVSLGRPLPGIAVVLSGEDGELVPEGSTGEICVAGPTVGEGYVDGGTGNSLQPLPLAPSGFYRTGDLGWRDSEGTLHFAGRVDAQIKYRGFRIEPGDIESEVSRCPGVAEAAVCLVTAPDRLPHLHALVVRDAEWPQEREFWVQLQNRLRERLPGHMVPFACTLARSLPRTLSGKLDRRALPALAGAGADSGGGRPATAESIADTLSVIWGDVLALDEIGREDNFFDLGGDSLSSIEVVTLAMDAGVDITLEQLFQHQTIERLSAAIAGEEKIARVDHASIDTVCQRYDVDSLRRFAIEALTAAGLQEEGARIVADVQLESSLRGQVTHNIGDIPRYARRLERGALNGRPRFEFRDTSPVSATLDGDNAPGQWIATVAMERAITLASRSGVGIVGVRRSNHFGAAGQYAWQAARSGYIGLCFTNGPVILAPTGGTTPLFGNNPLAIGVPRGDEDPVVLDIAMSVATRGKIGLTVSEGQPLEAGWILDAGGRPSTALSDLAAGLALPIGGHKGYGLAFLIEILAGALTGAGYCADHGRGAAQQHGGTDIGHLFMVIDPDNIARPGDFLERVNDIVQQAKTSDKADGVGEILVPGEIEFRARKQNLVKGVPLPGTLAGRLREYAEAHGLEHGPLPVAEMQAESANG